MNLLVSKHHGNATARQKTELRSVFVCQRSITVSFRFSGSITIVSCMRAFGFRHESLTLCLVSVEFHARFLYLSLAFFRRMEAGSLWLLVQDRKRVQLDMWTFKKLSEVIMSGAVDLKSNEPENRQFIGCSFSLA